MVALLHAFIVAALSTLVAAAPAPIETPDLFARTINGAMAAKCNNTQFTPIKVQRAAQAAASRVNNGTQVGRSNYPHKFNNIEGFQFLPGCEAPFYEFPIFTYKIYTGGRNNKEKPGPDRVVIGSVRGSDASFCGEYTIYPLEARIQVINQIP